MSSITINSKKHTIEMNKTFSAAASKFGAEEYIQLQSARRDYPTYQIITVAKKTAKPTYKGLTYEYMEKYIIAHDDDDKSIMAEYMMLRGKSDEGKDAMAETVSYAEIKEWFFMTFPAIEEFHSDRNTLLDKIAQHKATKQTAKNAA